MRRKIKACFFDFDGTLIDTIPMIIDSYRAVLAKWGIPFCEETVVGGIGLTMDDFLPVLLKGRWEDRDAFLRDYTDYQEREGNKRITAFPQAEELLRALAERKVPMGIVTSRRRSSVEELSRRFGLDDYFEWSICAGEASANKPHPEPLLKALSLLNEKRKTAGETVILPEECAYFGDAIHDIEAAAAAGMMPVLTDWTCVERELSEKKAELVMKSKEDFLPYLFTSET